MPEVNTVKGTSPAEDNKGQLSQIPADKGLWHCRLWRDNPEKRPAMADGKYILNRRFSLVFCAVNLK